MVQLIDWAALYQYLELVSRALQNSRFTNKYQPRHASYQQINIRFADVFRRSRWIKLVPRRNWCATDWMVLNIQCQQLLGVSVVFAVDRCFLIDEEYFEK